MGKWVEALVSTNDANMCFFITKVKCQDVRNGLPLTAEPRPFSDRTETNEKLHC